MFRSTPLTAPPSDTKSPGIAAFLENLAGRTTALNNQTCVRPPIGCGKPVGEFSDGLSAQEYQISGLCQQCQDGVFGVEDIEEDDEYGAVTFEDIRSAQAKGLTVFDFTLAQGRVVSLDIDKSLWTKEQAEKNGLFLTTSKSGRQHGFCLVPRSVTIEDQAQYAVDLGSDPIREKASAYTYENTKNPFAYLTFETPEGAEALRGWLKSIPEDYRRLVKELPKL